MLKIFKKRKKVRVNIEMMGKAKFLIPVEDVNRVEIFINDKEVFTNKKD